MIYLTDSDVFWVKNPFEDSFSQSMEDVHIMSTAQYVDKFVHMNIYTPSRASFFTARISKMGSRGFPFSSLVQASVDLSFQQISLYRLSVHPMFHRLNMSTAHKFSKMTFEIDV